MEIQFIEVTRQIVAEFRLQGCFLLDREHDAWVGDQPAETFRNYLARLFKDKPPAYFSDIRFFKYPDDGEAGRVTKYLALIPLNLEEVRFHFLGLIYENQEQFQELLKYRIMPTYLVNSVRQFVTEAKIRESSSDTQQLLLQALEEKRVYASQLENKVKSLSQEIDNIRNAEMTLDQKVAKLSSLLEDQNKEYNLLAGSYQELFQNFQDLQNEYMETCVAFEHKVYDLQVDQRKLKSQIRKLERGKNEQSSGSVSQKEYMELGIRLKKSLALTAKYTSCTRRPRPPWAIFPGGGGQSSSPGGCAQQEGGPVPYPLRAAGSGAEGDAGTGRLVMTDADAAANIYFSGRGSVLALAQQTAVAAGEGSP